MKITKRQLRRIVREEKARLHELVTGPQEWQAGDSEADFWLEDQNENEIPDGRIYRTGSDDTTVYIFDKDIDEDTWRNAWNLKVFGYINLTRLIYNKIRAVGF